MTIHRTATPAEPSKETRATFDTEKLATNYCRLMTLTGRNTTGWRVEPNGSKFDAVGMFRA